MRFAPQFDESDGTAGMGQKLAAYIAIEAVWLTALYGACFRYRPTVVFLSTQSGARFVQRASTFLQTYLPGSHNSIVKLSEKAYGSPQGRTVGEWLLINKILAPVSLPTKLWIAHRVCEYRKASQSAGMPDAVTTSSTQATQTSTTHLAVAQIKQIQ
mmetsp:Transcript_24856/g.54320  ORF Transcript_24856/g.54320 Transcript_24856/m.54320 type:complete len:157 (+) Transcript_24856:196-666(+)